VMQSRSELLEKALKDFERYRDTSRVSSDVREVLKAACEGRVADLFFQEVEPGNPGEDPLNAAALQTVRHRGRAFELAANDMPAPREVVAVLRF
jgi:hypothetical protein